MKLKSVHYRIDILSFVSAQMYEDVNAPVIGWINKNPYELRYFDVMRGRIIVAIADEIKIRRNLP